MNYKRNPEYVPGVDGLRAIAVLGVIAYHLWGPNVLPSGFLGVDIFFVISGFVITGSLLRRQHTSLVTSLFEFYSRRVRRILPALLVCVFFSGIITALFNVSPEADLKTGAFSLFGLSNLYLFHIASNYFAESGVANMFTQTWSLGVEEQYYLLFPLIFLGLSSKTKSYKTVSFVLVLITFMSLAGFLYMRSSNPNAAFYLPQYRFWELAIGALTQLLLLKYSRVNQLIGKIKPEYLLVIILICLFLPVQHQSLTTIATVCLTSLLILSIASDSKTKSVLNYALLIHLGKISYSLYLWHWTILVLSSMTIGHSLMMSPFQLLAMYLIALFSYKYVEIPFRTRQWGKNFSMTLLYGAIASCAVVSTFYVLMANHGKQAMIYTGGHADNSKWQRDSTLLADFQSTENESADSETLSEFWSRIGSTCHMSAHRLAPTDEGQRPKRELDEEFFRNCSQTDKQQLLILGDSFSNVISGQTFVAASSQNYQVNMILGYRCPFPFDPENIAFATSHNCEVEEDLIESVVQKYVKAGDIVVVRIHFNSQDYSNAKSYPLSQSLSAYDSELSRLIKVIKSEGAGLVVIGTNATVSDKLPCANPEWFNQTQCPEDSLQFSLLDDESNRYAVSLNEYLAKTFHEKNGSVKVIDPIKYICDLNKMECDIYKGNTMFYRESDRYHLSSAAVDLFYPAIENEIAHLKQFFSGS